jgi:hypothetical protein
MKTRVLLATLLAATIVHAAEGPPPLAPLPATLGLMGNGGPLGLPGTCETGIDNQKSMDGKRVYSVRCTNSNLASYGGVRQTFDTAQFRGKRVRVSGWLMASGIEAVNIPQFAAVPAEAGLWVAVGSASKGFRMDHMENRTIKGSTDWVQRDFVVDIPEDNNNVMVGFWVQGKGQIWARDLSIEEVPKTVALNTFASDPQQPAGPDLSLAALPGASVRAGDPFQLPPPKWLVFGTPGFELCDIGVDAQLAKLGQLNLSIACSIPKNAGLRQAPEAAPWWGKRVRFSCWIKTEKVIPQEGADAAGGAGLFLGVSGTQSPTVGFRVSGTTDWQYRELVMDVPRKSQWMPMGLALNGSGQVWVRDLKFEEVSRDTPVTQSAAIRLQ